MRVFPVKRNKIVFAAFEGDGGFGCNPRYIAEELHRRNKDLEMVWLTHDINHGFPEYIRPVCDTKRNTAYHLSTAKVWVDNYRKPFGTLKRMGQLYIQTWHATIGFKAVGLFRGDAFPEIARIVSEWDSNLADYFLSNSEYCDRIYPKKLLYNGPTLRTGSPRCDIIVGDREKIRKEIRSRYGLSTDIKLLLYTPTFRSGNQTGKKAVTANISTVQFDRICDALSGKFGGEWRVMLRLHPQLAAIYEEMPLDERYDCTIDVSQADDTSELIAASDALITDYSSCAFDAMFGGIPVFLYADDIEDYVEDRGELMWKAEELPFSIATDNVGLENNIRLFDLEDYKTQKDDFMNKHGVCEDGHASERVADVIEKWIK
ncbi:MAG: CDP-glycerol glycerophosphotransferase family protein [Lachnospiraceae bacterium]|nr:CDP-glycerol glycerophosphotransferase family protein [Lachnospiraceae bacterium]